MVDAQVEARRVFWCAREKREVDPPGENLSTCPGCGAELQELLTECGEAWLTKLGIHQSPLLKQACDTLDAKDRQIAALAKDREQLVQDVAMHKERADAAVINRETHRSNAKKARRDLRAARDACALAATAIDALLENPTSRNMDEARRVRDLLRQAGGGQ